MTEHRCQCRMCSPDSYPSGPRQGEHHAAVRFGDVAIWHAWLDGEPVENRCVEALAGKPGVVYLWSEPPHLCGQCHRNHCEQRFVGDVRIAREVLTI